MIEGTEENKVISSSEVKTEKKFIDLTTEDIKNMSEEQAKPYAQSQGWRDPENFSGDKTKLKSAKDYLSDTVNEMPILRNNFKKATAEIESLRIQMEENSKLTQKAFIEQKERHKKDLERKLAEAEEKRKKAKENFDVAGVEKETKNIVEFNNELEEIKEEVKTNEKLQEQNAKQKAKEWQEWTRSEEATNMMTEDYARYLGFERIVTDIYMQNPDLPTLEIIKSAKERAYPKVKKASNIEGATPSSKNSKRVNISQQDKEIMYRYADNACKIQRNKGVSGEALKKFRADYIKKFEKSLTEGEE